MALGLIDTHNHGCTNWFFAQNFIGCAEGFLKHEETTIPLIFHHNMELNTMLEVADKIQQASNFGTAKEMVPIDPDIAMLQTVYLCL